jgi:hypothetical protein
MQDLNWKHPIFIGMNNLDLLTIPFSQLTTREKMLISNTKPQNNGFLCQIMGEGKRHDSTTDRIMQC